MIDLKKLDFSGTHFHLEIRLKPPIADLTMISEQEKNSIKNCLFIYGDIVLPFRTFFHFIRLRQNVSQTSFCKLGGLNDAKKQAFQEETLWFSQFW
jgi:hypothetical protein